MDAACLSHSKKGGWKTPCIAYGHPNHRLSVYTLTKANREFHCPHCTHVTRPPALRFQGESARGHTVPVTQEKRRSRYAAEGKGKKLKISARLHTLFLLSEQPPSRALERINFKGHWKMLTDLKRAGPLCVHAFHCHQHKIRRLGSMSNYSNNVVVKGDKTFCCYALRKNNLVSRTNIIQVKIWTGPREQQGTGQQIKKPR